MKKNPLVSIYTFLVLFSIAFVWSCEMKEPQSIDPLVEKEGEFTFALNENVHFYNSSSLVNGATSVYEFRLSEDKKIEASFYSSNGTISINTTSPTTSICEIESPEYAAKILTDGFIREDLDDYTNVYSDTSHTAKKWFISFGNGNNITPTVNHVTMDRGQVTMKCKCGTSEPTAGGGTATSLGITDEKDDCEINVPGAGEITCDNNSCNDPCGCKLTAFIKPSGGELYYYKGNAGVFLAADSVVFNGITYQ